MNPEERAALERLLEYVGRGFCAVHEECRMLRKYLAEGDNLIVLMRRARELHGDNLAPAMRRIELTHLLAGGKTVISQIDIKASSPPTKSTKAAISKTRKR